MGSNQIVDVSGLTLPEELTHLHLYDNQIVDVSGLSLPPGLTWLYHNQIVDVAQLSLPKGLKELNLGDNQIADVSRLGLPSALKTLNIFHNNISDLSCINISDCPNLTLLRLSSNPVSPLEVGRLRQELGEGCEVVAFNLFEPPAGGACGLAPAALLAASMQSTSKTKKVW